MSILKSLDQYNYNNLYFCDTIKNNVMPNGNFIRILYCMHNFTMNGVYLHIPFTNVHHEKYYQKYKFTFDTNLHKEVITKLVNIEKDILDRVKIDSSQKTAQYKVREQIVNGCIKLHLNNTSFNTDSVSLALKISGIWETEVNYGLTYKFSKVDNVIST